MLPEHFPLDFLVSLELWDWFEPWQSDMCWGRWQLTGFSHLSRSGFSKFRSYFEMEEAWIWDTGCTRTLVNQQHINFTFLSHSDLLPKHGLAHLDLADWFQIIPKHLFLLIVSTIYHDFSKWKIYIFSIYYPEIENSKNEKYLNIFIYQKIKISKKQERLPP